MQQWVSDGSRPLAIQRLRGPGERAGSTLAFSNEETLELPPEDEASATEAPVPETWCVAASMSPAGLSGN